MCARQRIKQLLKAPFRFLGYDIVRIDAPRNPTGHVMPTWSDRLNLAHHIGLEPRVILDGGAFKGLWSSEAAGIFPGVEFRIVEPNPHVLEDSRRCTARIPALPKIHRVALGAEPGIARLNLYKEPGSDTSTSLLGNVSGEARESL
jgi:hypothetical protein